MQINLNRIILLVSGALPLHFYRQHQFFSRKSLWLLVICVSKLDFVLFFLGSNSFIFQLYFNILQLFFNDSDDFSMFFPVPAILQKVLLPFQCLVAGLFSSQRYQSYSTINLQLASYKLCHSLQQVKRQRNRFDKYKVEKTKNKGFQKKKLTQTYFESNNDIVLLRTCLIRKFCYS